MERQGTPSAGARDGERLAAQERHLRLVLAHLAGRAVRRRVEIDDLLQEVYLRALTAEGMPAPDEGEAALRRFLHRLARNTVIDAARAIRAAKRDGREDRLVHSDWSRGGVRASGIVARGLGPASGLAQAEGCARILAAFEALAPEHRRVLGLRQFEGLSAREAALRMGRSETAIHSLFRRALAAWERAIG